MNVLLAVFLLGLGLAVYFAEKLVKGAVGTSLGFRLFAFLVMVQALAPPVQWSVSRMVNGIGFPIYREGLLSRLDSQEGGASNARRKNSRSPEEDGRESTRSPGD